MFTVSFTSKTTVRDLSYCINPHTLSDSSNVLLNLGTIAPIEREVRDLASGLQAVKDEQEYIVVRERRHRDTAESTNARVMWWSVFQGLVLVRIFTYFLILFLFLVWVLPQFD